MILLVSICLTILVSMVCGYIAGKFHRLWLGFTMYSGYCFGKSAWEFVNHNPAAASSDLVVGLTCALMAFLWWLIERKNRRKKRNVLGLLGYKARAAKAKLLANMPQGGRSPGLNPA